ncbi:peptidoglycan-binding protein [Curtobacterium sp. NPDC090217]|uniref:peptidoglycan-binding domain-containing protein n=1 Tax=Curtobacterium sp. NPDC090217 TaxID=3363970 RepID=UPI0037FB797A
MTLNRRTRLFLVVVVIAIATATPFIAAPPSASAAPAGCVSKVLRAGIADEFCVARLQSLLNYDRFRYGQAPIAVDRRFGPLTDGRVRVVQSRSWITIDGIVGPGTWRVLCVPDAAGFTAMQVSVGCATL